MIVIATALFADGAEHAGAPVAVVVEKGRIAAIGSPSELKTVFTGAETLALADCAILPGLVNAHQHGRGISQVLLGYPDDALEPWIAGRRRHGAPDVYAVTRLAAEAMLSNGVTTTVHANYAYGTGAYEAELDAAARAYRDSGINATICVGYQDRGFLTYPPNGDIGPAGAGAAPYAGDANATINLLDLLRDRYRDEPCLTFALGPAGPQWVSDAAWRALAGHAARESLGLHFHLLESPAQAAACRALYGSSTLAHLRGLGVFEARASCAHGVYMNAVDMAVAREDGLTVVTNPGANLRLFNGAPPMADFYEAGCDLALGTDNTALSDDEDYLRELRLGALLARRPGIDATGPKATDMLRMGTSNGARAAFLEAERGKLTVGASADLIAIDLRRISGNASPSATPNLEVIMARGEGADIRLTMVAGTVRFRGDAADAKRLEHWREAAARSVENRQPAMSTNAVAELQADLRRHYQDQTGLPPEKWPSLK